MENLFFILIDSRACKRLNIFFYDLFNYISDIDSIGCYYFLNNLPLLFFWEFSPINSKII